MTKICCCRKRYPYYVDNPSILVGLLAAKNCLSSYSAIHYIDNIDTKISINAIKL